MGIYEMPAAYWHRAKLFMPYLTLTPALVNLVLLLFFPCYR